MVSWGRVFTRFRDGAGLELTFKAKLVPEWSVVGRMEQRHALAILGACCALDTTEMKAVDDQATAGSNTEDFLPGDRGARQTSTFADACQFGAACVCVARRGCPDRNATRRSLQVYASALLLCLWQDLFAELGKKIATRSGMMSSLGRKLETDAQVSAE